MVANLTDGTISDPINRALVEALWHSSEPLSAARYVDEYTDHDDSDAYVEVVDSRLAGLQGAGVVEVNRREEDGETFYVLGGDNASEAVRRLGLGASGRREM